MTKTFFLGLGGQKCGSSWIQAYLARQPGSDFGRLGEYQSWEHRIEGVFARYRIATPSRSERLRARLKTSLGASEPAGHLRWRLQTDPEAYFDYFNALCQTPGIQRTGDVTPSYAALPAEILSEIRDGLIKRGFEVRVIFAMRDPVARLVSHMRMDSDKGRLPKLGSPDETLSTLESFFASPEATARSCYDRTLATIAEVFPDTQVHVCLFEELFSSAGIHALARFAGVDAQVQAGRQKVNARESHISVPEDLEGRIARHYAKAYHAAAVALPQVSTLWPSARHVLATSA